MEDLVFTQIDPVQLRDDMLARMESATGELLFPGDERRIFAEGLSYAIAVIMSAANESCKKRNLKYASGYILDALGERVGCTRLSPLPGRTTLKFALSVARPVVTVIPAGTRATADSTVYFATDEAATIPAGAMEATVTATATTGGTKTNGIPAGAVQTIADDVPFVTGVVNTTESRGGDNGEPYPASIDPQQGDDGSGDDRYRERIALAPSSYSTAGTATGYEYHAKTASSKVGDVKVMSDQAAGTVEIYIVETGGKQPDEDTLNLVRSKCTAPNIKPLGDKVLVKSPEEITYTIDITYYCSQDKLSETIEAIEGENGAIAQYIAWQDGAIGRDINPDRLRALCLDSCIRLEVASPGFVSVRDSQIARHGGQINATHIVVNE